MSESVKTEQPSEAQNQQWKERKDAEMQREWDRIARRDADAQMRYYPALVPAERGW